MERRNGEGKLRVSANAERGPPFFSYDFRKTDDTCFRKAIVGLSSGIVSVKYPTSFPVPIRVTIDSTRTADIDEASRFSVIDSKSIV